MSDDTQRAAESREGTAANRLENTEQAAAASVGAAGQRYSAALETMRGLYLEFIDMAEANAQAAFDLAREIVNARGPSDVMNACTQHARQHMDRLVAQSNEIAKHTREIGQEIGDASTAAPKPPSVH